MTNLTQAADRDTWKPDGLPETFPATPIYSSRALGWNGTLSPQAAIDCFAGWAAEGFDQVIFVMPNVTDPEPFEVLQTRIIPEVEAIPVAGR